MSRAYWTAVPPHDLHALTDKQYEAVALIIHGATQREAAHLAGCSRNSIVKRLEAARHTIERNRTQAA